VLAGIFTMFLYWKEDIYFGKLIQSGTIILYLLREETMFPDQVKKTKCYKNGAI
jgi:hypothetical protein